MDDNGGVKCTGHGRRCTRLVSGQHTKNAGRAFYSCPLGRDDPKRCKFFKWEDELQSTTTPQKPPQGGQRLGQSPQIKYAKPVTTTPTKITSKRGGKSVEEIDEIDWNKVDTDELEHQAILSTPGSSQKASQDTPLREKLRAAVDEGINKRKLDDEESTPKRAKLDDDNPFLHTPGTPRTPSHPVLDPAIASLEQVSAHIQRQERLLHAADTMKRGLRNTIDALKDKNNALEAKVKALEAELARR